MTGRLIAVVGPSGAGKDSLIAALMQARPDLHVARRAITRPADPSEPFEPVDDVEFDRRADAGEFALHWGAHGLRYGIPISAREAVQSGHDVVANLSRGVLTAAVAAFPALLVLTVTAPPEILARRLAGRGREDSAAVAARLSRLAADFACPLGARCVEIDNAGPIDIALAHALEALSPQVAQ